ncbi:MAG: hypothetical protein K9J79_02375 [Desulfobacteraceae bacterium]|nr:hypothetical protein [Desulfobacteraceae bacterium]MCF8094187.1 hypothetical protein [Desulfobacteraceae bacterium]
MGGKEETLFFPRQHKKEIEQRLSVMRIGLFASVVQGADHGGSEVVYA